MRFKEDTDALKLRFDQDTVFLQFQIETDLESEFVPLAFCSLWLLIKLLLLAHIFLRSLVAGAAFPERGIFSHFIIGQAEVGCAGTPRMQGAAVGWAVWRVRRCFPPRQEWSGRSCVACAHAMVLKRCLLGGGGTELQLPQLGCWIVPDEARALQLFPSSEETPDNSTPRGLWALCFGSFTEEDS